MKKVIFQLEQLTCPSCMKKIETGLIESHGVEDAFVFFKSCKAKVEYDSNQTNPASLKSVIEELGFSVIS
ncbi:heavy-metal-associated domain-containing protein [Amphibacillus indicireducens]|uniref:Heavy-metal-associated domain-containing protein n=1 Tax=Amphibacillus indicireducens TaxID=1076330 RepID=A0ABP7W307_9BACI